MLQSSKVSWVPDRRAQLSDVWTFSNTPFYRTYAVKTFNKIFVAIYDKTSKKNRYTDPNACLVVLFKRALMYGTKL